MRISLGRLHNIIKLHLHTRDSIYRCIRKCKYCYYYVILLFIICHYLLVLLLHMDFANFAAIDTSPHQKLQHFLYLQQLPVAVRLLLTRHPNHNKIQSAYLNLFRTISNAPAFHLDFPLFHLDSDNNIHLNTKLH